jgi:osmotically-inducible protein OsmY
MSGDRPPIVHSGGPRDGNETKDIREAVKAELDSAPLVDASDITIKNMNGDVALNGTVPGYPQYREAGAAARRVHGVTSVHNHRWSCRRPATTAT